MTQIEKSSSGHATPPYYRGNVENAGANRLAQAMDVERLLTHARGQRMLDVNVGTGRLALPLARQGRTVTGMDASSAVLDECRRKATDVDMTMLVGDMFHVPLPDGAFDTVVAHRTFAAGSDWRAALSHWAQKLAEGGRILFEVDSADHFNRWASETAGTTPLDLDTRLRLSVSDIAEFASETGLVVHAVVPTRSFLCGDDANLMLTPRLGGAKRWQRFLTWLAVDDSLFDLACKLERHVFGRLTSLFSPCMLVILDKRTEPASNHHWLTRNEELNRLLTEHVVSRSALEGALGESLSVGLQEIEPLLMPLRNRSFLYRLTRPILMNARVDAGGLMPEGVLRDFRVWAERDTLDEKLNHLSETWADHADANLRDMAAALNYPLVRTLIADQPTTQSGVEA